MIFILLIAFQVKHFIADYPLQGKYMLGKFKEQGWIVPLSAHSGIHALFTFIIGLCFGFKIAVLVALLDFTIHFVVDRIKASKNLLGRFESLSKGEFKGLIDSRIMCEHGLKVSSKPDLVLESQRRINEIDARFKSNTYFWWALGWDQTMHHLTHYLIIYILLC